MPGCRCATNRTARFDLLIIDAFSSDSPPVHLLTVEAIADEVRTVKPDGLIAFHISNRYYDLAPAVAAAAERSGLTILEQLARAGRGPGTRRDAVALAGRLRDPATIAELRATGWTDVKLGDPAVHRRLRRPADATCSSGPSLSTARLPPQPNRGPV